MTFEAPRHPSVAVVEIDGKVHLAQNTNTKETVPRYIIEKTEQDVVLLGC
jgi:hypothetical protein